MQQGLGWHFTSHKPGFDKPYQPSLGFGHRGDFQVKLVLFQVKSVLFNSNWACNTAETAPTSSAFVVVRSPSALEC